MPNTLIILVILLISCYIVVFVYDIFHYYNEYKKVAERKRFVKMTYSQFCRFRTDLENVRANELTSNYISVEHLVVDMIRRLDSFYAVYHDFDWFETIDGRNVVNEILSDSLSHPDVTEYAQIFILFNFFDWLKFNLFENKKIREQIRDSGKSKRKRAEATLYEMREHIRELELLIETKMEVLKSHEQNSGSH